METLEAPWGIEIAVLVLEGETIDSKDWSTEKSKYSTTTDWAATRSWVLLGAAGCWACEG